MKINELKWNSTSTHVQYPFKENNQNEELISFLRNHYNKDEAITIENKLKKKSEQIVKVLEDMMEEDISEVSIIITIDNKKQLHIIDINPSGPQVIHDIEKFSENTLKYTEYLAEKKDK